MRASGLAAVPGGGDDDVLMNLHYSPRVVVPVVIREFFIMGCISSSRSRIRLLDMMMYSFLSSASGCQTRCDNKQRRYSARTQ